MSLSRSTMVKPQSTPWSPSTRKGRYGDMLRGVDGGVWLVKSVPLSPVADARDPAAMHEAAAPLMAAWAELAASATRRFNRRRTDQAGYREWHALLVNVPERWRPPKDHPLAAYLAPHFPNTLTARRELLFAVRLKDTIGTGSLGSAIDSLRYSLANGETPISDFEKDRREIDSALARSGLRSPSAQQVALADSWWTGGRLTSGPYLPHDDHIHFFADVDAAKAAKLAVDTQPDCSLWHGLPGEHTMSFSALHSFDLDRGTVAASRAAHWVSRLVQSGVVCVSMRGRVEPADITRGEIRRHKSDFRRDEAARAEAGTMGRAEVAEKLAELNDAEAHYAVGGGYPTLTGLTVTIAQSGRDPRTGTFDPTDLGAEAGVILAPLTYRQETAWRETMLCSEERANPHLQDVPTPMVAYSGLPSLSQSGERKGKALLGFTEKDRQPVWVDHMAATDADSLPFFGVVGQSGSGKSQAMMWLAGQWAQCLNDRGEKTPVIIIDPSPASDLSAGIIELGGQVYALDEIIASDGVFDAIRFSTSKEAGVDTAHALLMAANPFGDQANNYEAPLMQALDYGVKNGATCTGQALKIAAEAHVNTEIGEIYRRVQQLSSSPLFRAICGFDPAGAGLRVAGGLTYIRVGGANLQLPEAGSVATSSTQRISLALVRAMIYGSMAALEKRQGVVMFDEGWVMLSAGRAEMERVGRTARKAQVLPMFFTQRVMDALRAELQGYISRWLILPMQDPAEASAALQLCKLSPEGRLDRLTAPAVLGGSTVTAGAHNWYSMRALRDPDGTVRRGAIGLYVGLDGHAIPVEVTIPPAVLARNSTRRADVLARETLKVQ